MRLTVVGCGDAFGSGGRLQTCYLVDEGPKRFLVALGYAGWAAGQLENEIKENSWLNTPVDRAILFEAPVAARWEAATRLLGVDVTQLTAGPAGHA